MSNKPYTATGIKNVDVDFLNELFEDQSVTVGVDVAKDINVACLMGLYPTSARTSEDLTKPPFFHLRTALRGPDGRIFYLII
jgi:hypothetical protein